ncbi:MAG: hypothetical protein ABIO79_16500 [Ferruginibacter sp.]
MGLFDKLFKKRELKKPYAPEEDYVVTITGTNIRVEHPERETEQVMWDNIQEIKLINTDEGPWLPDVWLALIGKEDGCIIPLGTKGYNEVYDIVSKYEGFNFENVTNSMRCTDNAEFPLWAKKQ